MALGSFWSKVRNLVGQKSKIDQDTIEELEEILIEADVGFETTDLLIENLQISLGKQRHYEASQVISTLKNEIVKLMMEDDQELSSSVEIQKKNEGIPHVILVVGVNGSGKTTSIGKLAFKYVSQGHSVLLGASDTFRTGAIEQLSIWAQRAGCSIVKQQLNSDPAAVAYDTIQSAVAKKIDYVIIDTAGRLYNQISLMNELKKIKRSIAKVLPSAPHEVLLVLDGSTGQNAVNQAREFLNQTQVSGLVMTKLDGTAKGGVLIGISQQLRVPVRYIGTGEAITDLQLFDKKEFVNSLFG